ncbi:hypothetical protein BGW42_006771 [Actinomortierella wolfii]|nr:hypothetical protein BGW42_006771 [Actinomortierella wolfii]
MPRPHDSFKDTAELEERLAKLLQDTKAPAENDEDLARHFSKVFGQSPATERLHIGRSEEIGFGNIGVSGVVEHVGDASDTTHSKSQSPPIVRRSSSYAVPEDAQLDQDDIEAILAGAHDVLESGQDDLSFLDDLDMTPQERQEIRNVAQPSNVDMNNKTSVGSNHDNPSKLKNVEALTKEADDALATFMQKHGQAGRLGGTTGADDAEIQAILEQAQGEAAIEAKYGAIHQTRLQDLNARYQALKRDSPVPRRPASAGSQKSRKDGNRGGDGDGDESSSSPQKTSSTCGSDATTTDLGPPPKPIDLEELTAALNEGENPDDWCCICNEDAAWKCPGCDNDLYCSECFREIHVGPDADWELKRHRPTAYVKSNKAKRM